MKTKTQKTKRTFRHTNHPRNEKGHFIAKRPVVTVEQRAETMAALYEWRDARRAHAAAVIAARKEERFGGMRSLFMLALTSAVLFGCLIAGVSAHVG